MRKNNKATLVKALFLLIGFSMLASCVSDPDSPGFEFMPDMSQSPAIEPYVDYGWIKEITDHELTVKQSAKHPPIHAIPYRGVIENLEIYLPYQRRASSFGAKTHSLLPEEGWKLSTEPMGDYIASGEDVNPIQLTAENEKEIFQHGKELYTINCAHCHGKDGDGKGPMVESGAYMGVPDYHNLIHLKDGQMFYSIYYGRNMMGQHASFLDNYEIWTLVHYINKLMDKDYGVESLNKSEESDTTVVEIQTASID